MTLFISTDKDGFEAYWYGQVFVIYNPITRDYHTLHFTTPREHLECLNRDSFMATWRR